MGKQEGYASKDVQAVREWLEKGEGAVEGEHTKRLQQALKGVKEEELPRDGRYETAKGIGGKGNRFSKTDCS